MFAQYFNRTSASGRYRLFGVFVKSVVAAYVFNAVVLSMLVYAITLVVFASLGQLFDFGIGEHLSAISNTLASYLSLPNMDSHNLKTLKTLAIEVG